MKPASFKYYAPESLEEALVLKAQYGDEARILAGGQSLIPAMNFRIMQPTVLLDLNLLAELSYTSSKDSAVLHIGAMTRLSEVEDDPLIADRVALLHESLPYIAHPQIRNRGTVGGNIAHADPAAELPVIALATDSRFRVQSTNGSRWINSDDFFRGYFETAIEPNEILVELEVPFHVTNTGWAFLEVSRRSGDYAMAGIAVLITLDRDYICRQARLVYLNLSDAPLEAKQSADMLVGETLSDELIEQVANKASEEEIMPMESLHATVNYQRHLACILTKRALELAYGRAKET
tara:strand:+ start:1052 stop:1930 length:879 start_codon:yes stop_codon:yes gene_type:complete